MSLVTLNFDHVNFPSKFGHTRHSGSRTIHYVRDRRMDRQMDERTDKSNAYYPFPMDWDIIIN